MYEKASIIIRIKDWRIMNFEKPQIFVLILLTILGCQTPPEKMNSNMIRETISSTVNKNKMQSERTNSLSYEDLGLREEMLSMYFDDILLARKNIFNNLDRLQIIRPAPETNTNYYTEHRDMLIQKIYRKYSEEEKRLKALFMELREIDQQLRISIDYHPDEHTKQ
jgi:hypothetical protein